MINDKLYQKWGSEAKLKIQIAENIAKGSIQKREANFPQCKIVIVVLGEDPSCLEEIRYGVEKNLPIILVKGGDLSDKIIGYLNNNEKFHNAQVEELLDKGHFFILDTHNSEDLASFAHFFLTVTPY